MSLLRDREWALKYTADDGNLVRLFYVPALGAAYRYDRLTGYFTANALAVAARGVEGLIVNGGRMHLIAGCRLDKPEVEAIERGESLRDALERAMLQLPDLTAAPEQIDALELLAWMIANERLEVKVAVRCDRNRRPIPTTAIFHEKSGIIQDKTGDEIAFTGSANETLQGWTENWEALSVYTSWEDPRRVRFESENFAKLWADRAERWITRDIPTAVREKLLEFAPPDDQMPKRLKGREKPLPTDDPAPPIVLDRSPPTALLDERRREIWQKIATAALEPVGGDRVGEGPPGRAPSAERRGGLVHRRPSRRHLPASHRHQGAIPRP